MIYIFCSWFCIWTLSSNSEHFQNNRSFVCYRESIVLIQIFFCDQIMFWSFEFFGRDWLLLSILILKSMKSMISVVRCRESIVLIQIFFCDQICFEKSFIFYGRDWLLYNFMVGTVYIILIMKSMKSMISRSSLPRNFKTKSVRRKINLDQNYWFNYKNRWFHRFKD